MLKAKLVWISKIEMDFGGLSPNACNYMNCSGLQVNKEAEFSATFPVSKMWPSVNIKSYSHITFLLNGVHI